MDGFEDLGEFLSIVFALLIILLDAHNILAQASIPIEAPILEEFHMDMVEGVRHMDNIHYASLAALHFFQIWNAHLLGDLELGFWVKPRSTT